MRGSPRSFVTLAALTSTLADFGRQVSTLLSSFFTSADRSEPPPPSTTQKRPFDLMMQGHGQSPTDVFVKGILTIVNSKNNTTQRQEIGRLKIEHTVSKKGTLFMQSCIDHVFPSGRVVGDNYPTLYSSIRMQYEYKLSPSIVKLTCGSAIFSVVYIRLPGGKKIGRVLFYGVGRDADKPQHTEEVQ